MIAAAVLLAAAGLTWQVVRHLRRPEGTYHSSIPPPEGTSFWLEANGPGPAVLSPDGRHIAFTAVDGSGKVSLYVRSLDAGEARALSAAEGAQYPFWSPDGRSLGFFTPGKLKTIDAAGSPPLTLCAAPEGKGGSSDGYAVVAGSLDAGAEKLLLRSPAAAAYASGYLLFLRERTLMARPFDAARLTFTGEAVPVAERILMPASVCQLRLPIKARLRSDQ